MEDAHKFLIRGSLEEEGRPSKRLKGASSDSKQVSFFAVFDGHGGKQAAEYAKQHLFENIVEQPGFATDVERAVRRGFCKTEGGLRELERDDVMDGGVGTTATAALLVENTLYVANIGDSEAVLCSSGVAKVVTVSHTTSNEEERNRVKDEGGLIVNCRDQCRLGHPSWNPKYINLGVTRALGDFYFKSERWVGEKKSGLSANPTVSSLKLTPEDEFMIIASDGLWDVVSPAEAVSFVRSCIKFDNKFVCQALIQLGKARNSKDDITVLLINFHSAFPPTTCEDSS